MKIFDDSFQWSLDAKKALVKTKESEYQGTAGLSFWEKSSDENWIIPGELIKFWANILTNDSSEANDLAFRLYTAFKKKKKKDIEQITEEIENLLTKT